MKLQCESVKYDIYLSIYICMYIYLCVCVCFTLGPTERPGCTADDKCSPREVCRNRQCLNPCTELNPCARNAECQVCISCSLYSFFFSPSPTSLKLPCTHYPSCNAPSTLIIVIGLVGPDGSVLQCSTRGLNVTSSILAHRSFLVRAIVLFISLGELYGL